MWIVPAMALATTDRRQEGQLITLLELLARILEFLIDCYACAVGNGLSKSQGLPHSQGIGATFEWP